MRIDAATRLPMSGTLLSISLCKYFCGKKCVYESIPTGIGLRSVGDKNIDERLLAGAHRVAGARKRAGEFGVRFHALAVTALHAHDLLERRRRRKIGEELAVVLARRAVLEHRKRGAPHRAVS